MSVQIVQDSKKSCAGSIRFRGREVPVLIFAELIRELEAERGPELDAIVRGDQALLWRLAAHRHLADQPMVLHQRLVLELGAEGWGEGEAHALAYMITRLIPRVFGVRARRPAVPVRRVPSTRRWVLPRRPVQRPATTRPPRRWTAWAA
jgi:hypothetical protein